MTSEGGEGCPAEETRAPLTSGQVEGMRQNADCLRCDRMALRLEKKYVFTTEEDTIFSVPVARGQLWLCASLFCAQEGEAGRM